MSSAPDELRGRTKPIADSSDDEDYLADPAEFSDSVAGKFRARVEEYGMTAKFPSAPLYQVGEVVYLSVTGQSQPSGPYVIVSVDAAGKYKIKRRDDNQAYPQPIEERAQKERKSTPNLQYHGVGAISEQANRAADCQFSKSATVCISFPTETFNYPTSRRQSLRSQTADKDFAVFKRFGQLHARVLLHKQDEIIEIEERVDDLDEKEATSFYLRSRRLDTNVERRKLLADAEGKLLEYSTKI
ncbi:hypothetical protein SLS56_002453 [Neofusicoccum ribis]|uniref:DUF6594 domain-containing protein n=1 Tax=Neofusicoccum ribis TaxID=45134 RepID=A0ABR3T3N7_9PEZI